MEFSGHDPYKSHMELRRENHDLRTRLAAAETRAAQYHANSDAYIGALATIETLKAALVHQKTYCYKHFNGDDGCTCDEIDAALAATHPAGEAKR